MPLLIYSLIFICKIKPSRATPSVPKHDASGCCKNLQLLTTALGHPLFCHFHLPANNMLKETWNWALYKQPNWYEGQRKWHNVWRKQHGLDVQEHSPLSCTCWSIRTIFLLSPLSNVCLQLQLNLFKFLSVPEKEHSSRRSRIRRWGCSSVHMPVNKITDGT